MKLISITLLVLCASYGVDANTVGATHSDDIGKFAQYCNTNTQCNDEIENSICVRQTAVSPACPLGQCQCPTGYVRATISTVDKCWQQITAVTLGATCDSANDVITVFPTNIQCSSSVYACVSGTSETPAGSGICAAPAGPTTAPITYVSHMEICSTANTACTLNTELSCVTYHSAISRCRCDDDHKWDGSACVPRVWGDVCEEDSDCQEGLPAGVCTYGLCRCPASTHVFDTRTIWDSATESGVDTTQCWPTSITWRQLNETCSTSDSSIQCLKGLVCHDCNYDDPFRQTDGTRCRIEPGKSDPGPITTTGASGSGAAAVPQDSATEFWFRRFFQGLTQTNELQLTLSSGNQCTATSALIIASVAVAFRLL